MEEREERFIPELNVVLKLPQVCSYCGEEITTFNHLEPMGFHLHSIDREHEHWVMHNKTPMHNSCHSRYHSLNGHTFHGANGGHSLIGVDISTPEKRIVYSIFRNGGRARKVYIMQRTGYKTAYVTPILKEMLKNGLLEAKLVGKTKKGNMYTITAGTIEKLWGKEDALHVIEK